jgi:hypothetical protein
LFTNVTPDGRAPDFDKLGTGKPVAVTRKDPAVPTWNDAAAALVMDGAWFTVRVKD